MLDIDLFPPEAEYKLNENFGEKKSGYLRQVRINFGTGSDFAVINSSLVCGEWTTAKLVLLRGVIPLPELNIFQQELPKMIQIVEYMNGEVVEEELKGMLK